MISQQTKDLIQKKWPHISDNRTVLLHVKKTLMKYVHPFSTPQNGDEKFIEKANSRAKSWRFVAYGCGVYAVLTFIDEITRLRPIVACADAIERLIVAFVIYYLLYRKINRLLVCYKEIETEIRQNDETQQIP